MLVVETPEGERHEIFVIDYHMHIWDAREENYLRPKLAKGWIDCFYDYHRALSPDDYIWDYELFKWYGLERTLKDVFAEGYVDMAIFQPVGLRYFYREGFDDTDQQAPYMLKYPDRFILGSNWDPRRGEEGKRRLEEEVKKYRVRPWQLRHVKLYTAEWAEVDGKLSRGWRLDSREAFEMLELNKELGIDIQVPHKGPTVWPLSKDAFDVHDVDTAATSFPELNFVVTHSGAPRVDDFTWIGVQDKNVYAGLAVVSAFIRKRREWFSRVLAELLFWLGPDRILWGSDYALWHPKWLIEDFIALEFDSRLESEYGVELTIETKKKILGENAARLWGINIEEVKEKLRNDEVARKYGIQPKTLKAGG